MSFSSKSSNIYVSSAFTVDISGGGELQIIIFYGLVAATNTVVISSSESVVCRWIIYQFSDHNIGETASAGFYGLAGEIYTNGSGTNFDMPICPDPSYGVTADYTWLAFAIYDQTATYTCPSGFSDQINNIRSGTSEASIAVARDDYRTIQYDPGNWDTGIASNMAYITHTVRIPPGMYPETTPSGFGFFVPSNNVDLP